jgi:hypothetical protein
MYVMHIVLENKIENEKSKLICMFQLPLIKADKRG